METGMLVYDGPSILNGKPILGIVVFRSKNRKTGDMAQLYIIPKRVAPVTAARTGYDAAVCGECPMRHSLGGACYVNVGHGPQQVHNGYRNGAYLDNRHLAPRRELRRMRLRLGAYGDPAALPYKLVKTLAGMFDGHTGYTHQWRDCNPKFKGLVMASVETDAQRIEANAKGWRTFRVIEKYEERGANERVCANESHGVQCIDCMACHGKGGRADIVIQIHGTWGSRFPSIVEMAAAGG